MIAFTIRTVLYGLALMGSVFPGLKSEKAFHPLHVSTSDISYNAKEGKMEVICTIFVDDFESAIAKQSNAKIDLIKPEQHNAMDILVKKYIDANLHIKTNGTAASLTYVGYENNREVVNVYLETEKVALPKKVDAEVSLLHNLYNDQLNIVHITVSGNRKSAKLEFPNKTISQSF